MYKIRLTVIAFLLSGSILLISASEKIAIRFSPQTGEKLVYTLDSIINASGANLSGMDMSMGASAYGNLSLEIYRVAPNNIYAYLKSDDLLITLQSPANTRTINLATGSDQSLEIVFNRSGKVDEIKNLQALKTQNVMNFSILQIIRNYFPSLPSKPVEVGESWNDHRQMSIPFQGIQLDVLMNVRYTLESVYQTQTGPEASIGVEYIVTLSGKRSLGEESAVFDGTGKGTGNLLFIVNKGYFSEYRLNYKIESTMSIRNKTTTIMTLPIEVTVDASLDLIK